MSEALQLLNRELSQIDDFSTPSATKWNSLSRALSPVLSLPPDKIYVAYVSKTENLAVRLGQPGALKRRPDIAFALLKNASDLQGCVDDAPQVLVPRGVNRAVAICTQDSTGAWRVDAVLETQRGVGTQVAKYFPNARYQLVASPPAAAASRTPAGSLSVVPLVTDARTKRMVRLAIASAPAVLLVGPPGTGKTSLLREVINEIDEDPTRFGFTHSHAVRWVTPEESWTTRELVGGETVVDGHLRFRPGHVLNAIHGNEWLVLDEANRADMDKIFGGLLTWLSGQSVELGKAGTSLDAPMVVLDWARDAEDSHVDGWESLKDAETGAAIRFLAGTGWRLLGTYNALDAQRVFRFGQALGRRFVRVPVPPMSLNDFVDVLATDSEVSEDVKKTIAGLYEAHLASDGTLLGPALFFWIPKYVTAGSKLTFEDDSTATPAQLITEAYVSSAGAWLARLDDAELDGLRKRVTPTLISDDDWAWMMSMLPHLG